LKKLCWLTNARGILTANRRNFKKGFLHKEAVSHQQSPISLKNQQLQSAIFQRLPLLAGRVTPNTTPVSG
jgi:hypothetical protein